MTLRNFLLPVFAIAFIQTSCDLETLVPALSVQGDSGVSYSESRSLWLQMKKDNGDFYEYTVRTSSWTGNGNNTTITIEEGKPVARIYQEFFMDPDTGIKTIEFEYAETGSEVGTNEKGARPLTIDELYRICLAEYLVADPDKNIVSFNTDELGLMVTCGFIPKLCSDDCFEGITLSDFKWL